MGKYYSVIRKFNYYGGTDTEVFNYHDESKAKKKFNELAEKIKKKHGFYSEYSNKDMFTVNPDFVQFYGIDYDGDDDYYDQVKIKKLRYLLGKQKKLKFMD